MSASIGLVVIIVALYFIPTIIALLRGHRQTVAIAALNLLLGWTVLGWVGSLVWSLTNSAAVVRE